MVKRRILLFRLIALVLFGAVAGPLSAQDRPYIDPLLRPLLQQTVRDEIARGVLPGTGPTRVELPLGGALPLDRAAAGGPLRVGVFVELRGPGGLDELRAAGAEIGSVAGNIATARIPLDAFSVLVEARSIAMIEAARMITVQHDSSMRAIRADRVRGLQGTEWIGATGAGTLVAVYDTGLDFFHDDFIDATGATRVVGLWDQTVAGGGAPPGVATPYGRFCSREMIQAAIAGNPAACGQRDTNGHGTHVAGSAAGNGRAAPRPAEYAGVAPNAGLLIIKGGNGSFSEDRVVDGVRWARDYAEQLGQPVVVNLSLGGQFGPHDGSRLYEVAIDNLSGPGVVVAVAAGNAGWNYNLSPEPAGAPALIHARGFARPGVISQFGFSIAPYNPSSDTCNGNYVLFSMWYGGGDRLSVTVVRPNGSSATALPGQVTNAPAPTGQIYIDNGSAGASPQNGEFEVVIQVAGCGGGGAPMAGDWQIRVASVEGGSGRPFDIWLYSQNMGLDGFVNGTSGFDNRFIVNSPGNAQRAVTVGAFATKLCWFAQVSGGCGDGRVGFQNLEAVGDIARFSSAGPTRDGRMKPEITAPGIAILSSRSSSITTAANVTDPGGRHFHLWGTSMAAPHVAGAIALLFERRPDLTPEDVKEILSRTAIQDAFTLRSYGPAAFGGAPTDWWGFGKLNVEAALLSLAEGVPVASLTLTPSVDTLPQGASVRLRADARGPEGEPVFARLAWRSTNPAVATVDPLGVVRALQPGTTRIIVTADGLSAEATIVVTPPTTLVIASASASPDSAVLAPRGTRLPLLTLRLEATPGEPVEVRTLGFDVVGQDPGARLVLIRDREGDGRIDASDPVVGATTVALTGGTQRVLIQPDTLRVRAGEPVHLILAVEVSGGAPNMATFQATLVPEAIRTVGLRSGAMDRFTVPGGAVASRPATTTLLGPGQLFALSENPVRGQRLIFNFRETPATAGVYTVAGARVADLTRRVDGTRVEWDLTNDDGGRVAPGVYLMIFEVSGEMFRERLIILTPASTSGQE